MAERRYYRVAGHVFSLEAESHRFAGADNYAPFRIADDAVRDDEFRFALQTEVLPELALPELGAPFFVDSSDDDMPRIEVYRMENEWIFRVAVYKNTPVVCVMRMAHDFRSVVLQTTERHFTFALNNAVMLSYAFSTAPYLTLEMHAAVIVRHGMAQLFLGKSGTGKSTHARLWLQAFPSAWLLNDDNPILRLHPIVSDNGTTTHELRVYGSPWSGKTPCYKNASAPVAAIVKLSQAPHNEMRPLRLPEAYAYVLSSASGLKIIPEMMDALYTTIAQTVQTVPMYQLDCLPDTAAAQLCQSTIYNR